MENSKEENKGKRGRKKGCVKTGGRKPGTPNKKSIWLKDELQRVGLSWGEEFKKALNQNDYQKATILANLLPYLNPRLKDVQPEQEPINEEESPTSRNQVLEMIK